MADDVDRAASRTEEMLQDALDAQGRKARKQLASQSAMECCDCGENIPEARRLAILGVQRCVICQTKWERVIR